MATSSGERNYPGLSEKCNDCGNKMIKLNPLDSDPPCRTYRIGEVTFVGQEDGTHECDSYFQKTPFLESIKDRISAAVHLVSKSLPPF